MPLKQDLQQIAQSIQSGTVNQLTAGLRRLSTIGKLQLQANQSSVDYALSNIIEAVRLNIRRNRSNILPNMKLPEQLKMLANRLPKRLSGRVGNAINQLKKETNVIIINNQVDEIIKAQIQNIQKQIVNDAIQQDDIKNIDFSTPKLSVMERQMTGIQRSILPFSNLLQKRLPTVTKPSQMPSSVRFLSQYAKVKGRIGVGAITDSTGVSFIGVKPIQKGNGVVQFLPYQKNQIMQTQLPNIPIQLQYHANKTINSWNKFIGQQSKLVKFLDKINTSQNRQQYVKSQFKNMNLYTICAQSLASLCYYYVYIPIQKILLKNYDSVSSTQQFFYDNYQVGNDPKVNPLLLGNVAGKSIAQLLLNYQKNTFSSPTDLQIQINKALKKLMNSVNQKQIQKILQWRQKKTMQAYAFLQQSGLPQQLRKTLLATQDFSSIKKKKFLLSRGFQNNQLVQIAKQITNQSQNKPNKPTWDQIWGSQQLYCYDYIWNRQRY